MKYNVEIMSWSLQDGVSHCTLDSTEEFEDLEVAEGFVESFNSLEPDPEDTWYLWAYGPFSKKEDK